MKRKTFCSECSKTTCYCQTFFDINTKFNESSFFFLSLDYGKKDKKELFIHDLVLSIPVIFKDENFIKDSNEREFSFLLNGIITQNKTTPSLNVFFMSDYVNDKNNDTWYLFSSKKIEKKFNWSEMWKSIVLSNHIPIFLIYVRLYFFINIQINFYLK